MWNLLVLVPASVWALQAINNLDFDAGTRMRRRQIRQLYYAGGAWQLSVGLVMVSLRVPWHQVIPLFGVAGYLLLHARLQSRGWKLI